MLAQLPNRLSLSVLATLAACGAAIAQCPPAPTIIQGSDASYMDYFGSSMDADTTPVGTMMVVGSVWRTTPGVGRTGVVSSYVKSGSSWTETALLAPADLIPLDEFGVSVAFADPYLIVGASGVDFPASESGAVYFFERSGTGWISRGRLFSLLAPADSKMGSSVDITDANGGWAVAGAPMRPNGSIVEAGGAYLFKRLPGGTWSHTGTIFDDASADGGHWQELGRSVAIDGDVLVVGAPVGDVDYDQASISGYIKVYRYQNGNWVQSGPARWESPRCCGYFGDSVDTDGTYIVVGAPRTNATATDTPLTGADEDAGCAYVYKWNTSTSAWDLDGTLYVQTDTPTYDTAQQVRIHNGKVYLSNTTQNRVYQFRRAGAGNWVQETAFSLASADTVNHRFADDFAVAGSSMLISDNYYGTSPEPELSGAVYAFDIPTAAGNDACNGAKSVPAGTYTGCTTFATLDGSATCGQANNTPGPDVWFAYTPTCTQNVVIDTIGSNYDTILSIHASCPDLSESNTVVCNDDAGGSFGQDSMVSFNVTAGTRYLIRVSGYNGASGSYTLRIAEFATTPSNNACSAPVTVTSGNIYTAASCTATTDGPATGTCASTIGKDLWYRFTPTASGTLTLNTCGSNFDTVLAVYPGSTCPTTSTAALACNDDSGALGPCSSTVQSYVSLPVTAGVPCTIRVGGWNSASGNLSLSVNFTANCPADFNNSGTLTVQDIFDFLNAWFAGTPNADFNNAAGITVQDIFDFLNAWFAGCP